MAGLIGARQEQQAPQQQSQAPNQANPDQPGAQPQQGGLPPEKQAMFGRALEAAQKLMYSERTRPLFLKLLQGADDPVDAASGAAVKVVTTIVDETKGKLDPSLVVPIGIAIVGDIMDFIEKTNDVELTTDQAHQAVAMFLEKMDAAVKQGGDSMIQLPQGV